MQKPPYRSHRPVEAVAEKFAGACACLPDLVEDLSTRTYDLYADAEERLLSIVAQQFADRFEAPGWAQRKLATIKPLRHAAQAVVAELGRAVSSEVFDVVTEAYSHRPRAAVAELLPLQRKAEAKKAKDKAKAQAKTEKKGKRKKPKK